MKDVLDGLVSWSEVVLQCRQVIDGEDAKGSYGEETFGSNPDGVNLSNEADNMADEVFKKPGCVTRLLYLL